MSRETKRRALGSPGIPGQTTNPNICLVFVVASNAAIKSMVRHGIVKYMLIICVIHVCNLIGNCLICSRLFRSPRNLISSDVRIFTTGFTQVLEHSLNPPTPPQQLADPQQCLHNNKFLEIYPGYFRTVPAKSGSCPTRPNPVIFTMLVRA